MFKIEFFACLNRILNRKNFYQKDGNAPAQTDIKFSFGKASLEGISCTKLLVLVACMARSFPLIFPLVIKHDKGKFLSLLVTIPTCLDVLSA